MVDPTSQQITQEDVENSLFGYKSGYLAAATYKAEITTYPLSTQELPTPAVMFFTTSNQGMVIPRGCVNEHPTMHCCSGFPRHTQSMILKKDFLLGISGSISPK